MILFPVAAEYCQQDKRTCRRPECPGNQATFFCAPTFGFSSFSSTQWPLTGTNHLVKTHCTTILFTETCSSHGRGLLFSWSLLRKYHCVPLLQHQIQDYWGCATLWKTQVWQAGGKDTKLCCMWWWELAQDQPKILYPRNITTANKSTCYYWQEWGKNRSKQVENYCCHPKKRNLCSFI